MAERKVLNKYYPPDFDPSKLRSFEKKTTRKMCNVRMMLPMTVRCYTCHQYMYIGTKFNMKVETVQDEDYLGIKIYRFYFKCTNCYSEITFKTDPKNNDYVAEFGASRNHEPWKDMLLAEEEYKAMKKQEMKEDVMKSLEYRTYDSKREMDILDAMDQVKTLNRRENNVNYDELIRKVVKEEDKVKEELEKDKERIKKIFEEKKKKKESNLNEDNKNEDNNNNVVFHNEEEKNEENLSKEQSIGNNNTDDGLLRHKLLRNESSSEESNNDKEEKMKEVDNIFKLKNNGMNKFKLRFKKQNK